MREQRDRFPAIPPDRMTDAQKAAVSQFEVTRNAQVSGPFIALLRSPELMTLTSALGSYVRFRSALPARLSEFIILLTASQWKQQYEWDVHMPIALQAGVKLETVRAIAEGVRPPGMSDEEDILYDFCSELHHSRSITDGTYARGINTFGEQGVIDALGITGYYTMLAMILNTANTPAPTLRLLCEENSSSSLSKDA